MRAAIAAVLLLTSGACKQEAPVHPGMDRASVAELDALWALAPANARGGIAISAHGLAMLEDGAGSLHALLATAPDLPEHRRHLESGPAGYVAMTSVIGALAAVAIPMFVDSPRAARPSDEPPPPPPPGVE
jgi:hypothetical protein